MGRRLFDGNNMADKYAKLGAAMHAHTEWCRQAYIDKYHVVLDMLEYAARVSCLGRDLVDTRLAEPADLPPPAAAEQREETQDDDVVPVRRPARRHAPEPRPREHLIAEADANGHHLVVRERYVFCRRCACFAQTRWLALKSPCRPKGTLTGRLNRLWRGLHPTTAKPL